jgi:hypothetical protein
VRAAAQLDGESGYAWRVVFLIPWMWFSALFLLACMVRRLPRCSHAHVWRCGGDCAAFMLAKCACAAPVLCWPTAQLLHLVQGSRSQRSDHCPASPVNKCCASIHKCCCNH